MPTSWAQIQTLKVNNILIFMTWHFNYHNFFILRYGIQYLLSWLWRILHSNNFISYPLERQLNVCAKANPQTFTCHKCNERFTKLEYLQQHVWTYENVAPDQDFSHGERSFMSSTLLHTHFRTHTGDKPYKCQHCEKSYCWSSGLQIHLRTHTGDKPFKCEHYGKNFSESGNLQKHLRIHTGDKP